MGSRALVTGARGFIGQKVARLLSEQGFSVQGLGHGAWAPGEWSRCGLSAWREGDVAIENLLEMDEPDLIVHCAGGASVAFSMQQPLADFRRTVDSTAAVLEWARLHAPDAAVVLVSSGSLYGSAAQGSASESAPLAPQSPYAVHKRMAEELCAASGRFFGVRSVAVRLFSVYGPGLRKQLLWDACTRLVRGDSSFAGTGAETRDWVHVDDAADLIVRAAGHASCDSPVVNGGTGAGASVREVVAALAGALGHPGPVTFTGAGRPGDPFRFVADNRLALSWGWAPKTPWRAGVEEYAAWFARGAP